MAGLRNNYLCLALLGAFSVFSMFSHPDPPDKSIKLFAELFLKQDAKGILGLMHPDVVAGLDFTLSELQERLSKYRPHEFTLENITLGNRTISEDKTTERLQATLTFRGPRLNSPNYPNPTKLRVTMLWVLEEKKWWLERSTSFEQTVESNQLYPTPVQEQLATEFQATLSVLDKLKAESQFAYLGVTEPGSAYDMYKDLGRYYERERSDKGISVKAEGLYLFLRAVVKENSGLHSLYYGDFKRNSADPRKPAPWRMFNDYVQAAFLRGKKLEKEGKPAVAAGIYKKIISFGNQLIDGAAGMQFALWGATYQKQGAEHLAKISDKEDKAKTFKAAQNAARRIDLLLTCMNRLSDMADYGSLKAALVAAERHGDPLFSSWGLNTLAIFAYKGAPVDEETAKPVMGRIMVSNPRMTRVALAALERSGKRPEDKEFIQTQKEWVAAHDVYNMKKF